MRMYLLKKTTLPTRPRVFKMRARGQRWFFWAESRAAKPARKHSRQQTRSMPWTGLASENALQRRHKEGAIRKGDHAHLVGEVGLCGTQEVWREHDGQVARAHLILLLYPHASSIRVSRASGMQQRHTARRDTLWRNLTRKRNTFRLFVGSRLQDFTLSSTHHPPPQVTRLTSTGLQTRPAAGCEIDSRCLSTYSRSPLIIERVYQNGLVPTERWWSSRGTLELNKLLEKLVRHDRVRQHLLNDSQQRKRPVEKG